MQLTASSPITKIEISTAYSKDEYRQQTKKPQPSGRVNAYLLHYQIAMGQKDNTCLNMANNLAAKSSLKLNAADQDFFHLTPLMLAILMGRRVVASGIASLLGKAQINVTDEYGFSALHHAALCQPDFTNELISKGADPAKKTPLLATYESIKVYGGHTPGPASKMNVKVLDSELGKLTAISHLSLDRLRLMTNGLQQFRSLPLYVGDKGARELWQSQSNKKLTRETAYANVYAPILEAYFANPPKLVLKKSLLLSSLPNALGLFAGQDIERGRIIDEYGGVCGGRSSLDSDYVYRNFDGESMGGVSTRANCGFPNAFLMETVYQGSIRIFLLAIDCIEKGQEICISYGPCYETLVHEAQVILRGEEMKAFFSKIVANGKEEQSLLSNSNHQFGISDGTLEKVHRHLNFCAHQHKIAFPLIYPSALIYLTCHNVVRPQIWLDALKLHTQSILDANQIVIDLMQNYPKSYSYALTFCQIFKNLEDCIIKSPGAQPCIDATKQWALNLIGKEQADVIFLGFYLAAAGISSAQFKPENSKHYLEMVYRTIKEEGSI